MNQYGCNRFRGLGAELLLISTHKLPLITKNESTESSAYMPKVVLYSQASWVLKNQLVDSKICQETPRK